MNFMIRPYQRGEEQYVADLHKKLYLEELLEKGTAPWKVWDK